MHFLKTGFPVMMITVVVAAGYLILRFPPM